MISQVIGAVLMGVFIYLFNYARKNNLVMNWWKWAITVSCFLYTSLVLEVIAGFLKESAPQAALVMGSAMAIVAVIWGVLLKRFVFNPAK